MSICALLNLKNMFKYTPLFLATCPSPAEKEVFVLVTTMAIGVV